MFATLNVKSKDLTPSGVLLVCAYQNAELIANKRFDPSTKTQT